VEIVTPYETVLQRYTLPFDLYPYQVKTVNELAPLQMTGHYLAVGVGKTATSTVSALYKFEAGDADQAIVLMPPILLASWERWINSIKGASVLRYQGSPSERKKMTLDKMFILMSYDIFKREYDRFVAELPKERTVLICDEATAIKNIESKNYKAVKEYSEDGQLMLLTGTPLSKILDGYAYVKLIAPWIYRTFAMFKNIHVAEYDFWKTPIRFHKLDLLERNMQVNAVRILKEDVLTELPEITYSPVHYDLSTAHWNLYKRLAEEQLLEYEDGSKLDATEATKLWQSLQQIVMNYGHFSGNPSDVSAGFELIDETMEQLLGTDESKGRDVPGKLIIFTNYKMTSRNVLAYTQKYGSVAVYGEVSAKQQQANIDRFMSDPTCRVLVAQVQSAGYGLNLQGVCSDVLFLEAPLSPIQFEQAVGRVYRNGQKNKVHIRVGIAQGTIQVHLCNLLMKKDSLVNRVIRNFQDIRVALYGE
jgi:SNF2 family DNA or RNA helicase